MAELGFTKSHLDAASHSDLSFIDTAAKAYHSQHP
jgi:hypothetical protein